MNVDPIRRLVRRLRPVGLCLALLTLRVPPARAAAAPRALDVEASGGGSRLVYVSEEGRRVEIGRAEGLVLSHRLVHVQDAEVLFAAWDETGPSGAPAPRHRVSLSLDQGASWSRPVLMTYDIPLRAGVLKPSGWKPPVPPGLTSGPSDRVFIVQFETTGLAAWRGLLSRLGVEVLQYLPEHAHVVRMDPALVPTVAAQPFVRWVGPYHPGYRIEPEVLADIATARVSAPPRRYHLMTYRPDLEEKRLLAEEVTRLGGRIESLSENGYIVDATLTLDQVAAIARSQRLQWLDRWSPPENDMDIVREVAGSNYIESVRGYAGQGIRGEVMDAGVQQDHPDFDGIQIHGPAANVDSHGTSTYGIVFGNGNRDGDGQAKATSNLPLREAGWFYDYDNLTDRYQETAELIQPPIQAMFQSNSWGDARVRAYTSISQEMDDIIWLYDVAIFQSQSNAGNQDSRPQAWAKNVISIGALNHYDTPSLADDCWCFGASIGPAADGRIKPDLAYWYDAIYTTTTGSGYTSGFNGTSAATPITAGIGGLFFQMWADNILGNDPPGSTAFEKRPHASTMKALMINTAEQYPFTGTADDRTRMHQGWGLPSAKRFYDRAPLMRVVNEENPLQELDVHTYTASVPPGQTELKVTMVYTDRAGTTSSALHRINDVTLKVTDPFGTTTWWGNVGLDVGVWSVAGGAADTKNNVENVFIQNPAAGDWTIEVSADDLNLDQHSETPEVDQDYALVVSGVDNLSSGCAVPPAVPGGVTATALGDNRIQVSWSGTATARQYRVYRAVGGCGGTYTLIGTVPKTQTSWTDTAASGGILYSYVVRASENCESADSNCASVTAVGPCLLTPNFAGLGSATSNDASSCGVTLAWPAATTSCGGPVAYNVYRSTTAGFTPSTANRIASCVSGTSFVDTRNLGSNTLYYYVVRAEDLGGGGSPVCGGAAESNAVVKSALTRGTVANIRNWGFEAGMDGWVAAKGMPAATAGDWVAGDPNPSTSGGQQTQPGDCASGAGCLFTGQNKGGNPNNGDVDDGEVMVTSPAFDASAYVTATLMLKRWHYNGATANDPNDHYVLEVSNNNGTSYTGIESLGPLVSANTWTQVSFPIDTLVTLTSQMKLRVRTEDGIANAALVETAIDDIRLDGAQMCTTIASGAVGGISPSSLRVVKAGSKLKLTWNPDCGGGVSYGIYRGNLAGGYATLAPLAGSCGVGTGSALVDPSTGSYFFLVAPNDGSVEGSLGRTSTGALRPQPATTCFPRAASLNACTP